MEEVKRQEMPFEGRKVAEAVAEIIAQGPDAIGRIMKQEVEPFIRDIQTLATSMANLYKEHAAHFIALGVRVNIEVQVMGEAALKSQVGANILDENDINRVAREDKEVPNNAAASVQ